MSEKKIIKPVALAVGAALAGTFAISGAVNADSVESPFAMSNAELRLHAAARQRKVLAVATAEKKEGEGAVAVTRKVKAAAARKKVKAAAARRKAKAAAARKKAKAAAVRRKACGADTDEKKGEGSCGGSAKNSSRKRCDRKPALWRGLFLC